MADFRHEIDKRKCDELAKKYPKDLLLALRQNVWKAILHFRDLHRKLRLSGRPGLKRRTGALMRSFKAGVSSPAVGMEGLAAWLASGSSYASIHERGGVITAKPGKALAVPLSQEMGGEALTPSGVLRGKFAGPLRNVPGLELVKNKRSGKAFLMERRDVLQKHGGHYIRLGQGLVPMFVLCRSVKIPPRLRFIETFREWVAKPKFMKYFRDAVEIAWKRVQAKK